MATGSQGYRLLQTNDRFLVFSNFVNGQHNWSESTSQKLRNVN